MHIHEIYTKDVYEAMRYGLHDIHPSERPGTFEMLHPQLSFIELSQNLQVKPKKASKNDSKALNPLKCECTFIPVEMQPKPGKSRDLADAEEEARSNTVLDVIKAAKETERKGLKVKRQKQLKLKNDKASEQPRFLEKGSAGRQAALETESGAIEIEEKESKLERELKLDETQKKRKGLQGDILEAEEVENVDEDDNNADFEKDEDFEFEEEFNENSGDRELQESQTNVDENDSAIGNAFLELNERGWRSRS